MKTMYCPFCENKSLQKRIVIQNKLAFAFPTNIPIVSGHILISPKRHVRFYEDLTTAERKAIEALREKLARALTKAFRAEGFNYAWNEGDAAGQSVPHFHLHMLPRKKGDDGIYRYEPRKFLYRPRPRKITTPEQELQEVAHLIRNALTR
ncbi:MAG: HIT domain-containing protein [Candidatus Taylorbacteria bacterium]|nr:HIT domain-containing protein [Candidatus Taylorbacteria bacterium]